MVIGPTQKSRLAVTKPRMKRFPSTASPDPPAKRASSRAPTLRRRSSTFHHSPSSPPTRRLINGTRMFSPSTARPSRNISTPMARVKSPRTAVNISRRRSVSLAPRKRPKKLPKSTVATLRIVPVMESGLGWRRVFASSRLGLPQYQQEAEAGKPVQVGQHVRILQHPLMRHLGDMAFCSPHHRPRQVHRRA